MQNWSNIMQNWGETRVHSELENSSFVKIRSSINRNNKEANIQLVFIIFMTAIIMGFALFMWIY